MGAEEVAKAEMDHAHRGGDPAAPGWSRHLPMLHLPILAGVTTIGGPGAVLTADQVTGFVRDRLAAVLVDGRSVCLLVPDGTRTCPLPMLLSRGARCARGPGQRAHRADRARHAWRDERARAGRSSRIPARGGWPAVIQGCGVLNHRWEDPAALTTIGVIDAARMASLSDGLIRREVPVRINREVLSHDVALVVGPVLSGTR